MVATAGFLGSLYTAQRNGILSDHTNEIITVPHATQISFTTGENFAWEFWLKFDAIYSAGDIAGKGIGILVSAALAANTKIKFSLNDGVNNPSVTGAVQINDDLWHHIVVTRDTAGNLAIFVDGAADGTVADTSLDISNVGDITINTATIGDQLDICLFRIWNKALILADVQALYAGRLSSGLLDYLVGWYSFMEGTGNVITDVSQYKNHASVVNTDWGSVLSETATADGGGGAGAARTTTYVNIDWDGFVAYDGGVAIDRAAYTITPKGTITLDIAPVGAFTCDYTYWPICRERAGVYGWNLTEEVAELPTTGFINYGTGKSFIPGMLEWTATFSQYWVSLGHANDLGTPFIVKFWWDRTNAMRYEGWGLVKGINPNAEVGSLFESPVTIRGTYRLGIETA